MNKTSRLCFDKARGRVVEIPKIIGDRDSCLKACFCDHDEWVETAAVLGNPNHRSNGGRSRKEDDGKGKVRFVSIAAG